ncbi:MAG: serine protease [Phycisphaerae bacterium]|nr:MAG: serine protease [Phycisphaerae bacterium]
MVSWNDVRLEIDAAIKGGDKAALDKVRRQKIQAVVDHTKRPLIIYASDFLGKGRGVPDAAIDFGDKDGFREVTTDLGGDGVDVILHSPGGSAEATESIVKLLRSHFKHVRFLVPDIAKSAATMLALSGDEILMDSSAELGPIDPQFQITRGDGSVVVAPAQAIIDQFDAMEKKTKDDPRSLPVHIPILQLYAPSLYQQARNAIGLSHNLVKEWLSTYMFAAKKPAERARMASAAARYLGDHNKFKSHSKGVRLEDFRSVNALKALRVTDLSADQELHSRVRALHYAIGFTFNMSTTLKIFENSAGRAMIRHLRTVQLQIPGNVQQVLVAEREPEEPVKPT